MATQRKLNKRNRISFNSSSSKQRDMNKQYIGNDREMTEENQI